MQSSVLMWDSGHSDTWTYQQVPHHIARVVFELEKVPDFSSSRFLKLGERLEDRRQEVARQQLQMLRQFHSLGQGTACSLKFS